MASHNKQGSRDIFKSSFAAYPTEKQKRKKARIPVSMEGTIDIPGHKSDECHISSLGTGGLTISTRSTLYTGELVRIQFVLQDRDIMAEGEIVRINGKEAGIKFVQIEESVVEQVQSYIFKEMFNNPSRL